MSQSESHDKDNLAEPQPVDGDHMEQPDGSADADSVGQGDPLDLIKKQRDEVEENLLRLKADYHNFIRRSRLQLDAELAEQIMDVAKTLVIVMDQFDHALDIDPKKTEAMDVLAGVKIVRDELLKALDSFDIKRLDARRGQEFDPMRHEALMRQKDDDVESNHIVAQLQPGYVLGDKTVRPAKVTVAE